MQTVKSVSWVRMVLAFAAVLIVAGSGIALAGGPNPQYVPQSSVLLGPGSVPHGGTGNYVLEVTFVGGSIADFPPTTGNTFSAAVGTITGGGVYTAPATGPRDRVSGSFFQNGVTTTASRIIALTP